VLDHRVGNCVSRDGWIECFSHVRFLPKADLTPTLAVNSPAPDYSLLSIILERFAGLTSELGFGSFKTRTVL